MTVATGPPGPGPTAVGGSGPSAGKLNGPVRVAWLLGCFFISAGSLELPMGVGISDACFALAVVGLLLNGGLLRARVDPWVAAASGLAVVAIGLGSAVPDVGSDHVAGGARLLFIWICLFLAVTQIVRTVRMAAASMVSYAAGCAVSGVLAVSQALTGMPRFADPGNSGHFQIRNPGWSVHVNDQGAALAVAVALCTGLLFTRNRVGPSSVLYRLTLTAILGPCVTGLILCGSITGMGAAVVGCLAALSQVRFRPITYLGFAVSAAAAVTIGLKAPTAVPGGDPISRYRNATGQRNSPSSLEDRMHTWRFALGWLADHPLLGRGLGESTGGSYNGERLVHNIGLLFWYQGGLLLLIALLVILARLIWAAVALLRARHPLAASLFGGLTAALVFAQTAAICYQRYFWLPGLLIIGLLANRHAESRWPPNVLLRPTGQPNGRPGTAAPTDSRDGSLPNAIQRLL
jgi:O-antigen ligase